MASPIAVYTEIDDTDLTDGVALLAKHGFEVRMLGSRDRDEILAAAADAEVLLVGYAEITREMIEALPKLRLIALMSMGFNNVDIEAATEHGVWVTNVPGAATEEVATHALALLLHVARQFDFYTASATAVPDEWNSRAASAPVRLSEKTLGIVGLGKIGRKLAELARPLFGRVIGYDPLLPDTDEVAEMLADLGIERTGLDEVRAASDVLSLHVPLTPETERMVDAAFIDGMREGAVVINVSRGALIDADALAQAVRSGRLAGAGLDVLAVEPPPADDPLLGVDGIVITPHVAYYSERTDAEYVRIQAQNAVSLMTDGRPDTPINTGRVEKVG